MSIIVQKYGGTSLGSVELIESAAERALALRAAGHDVVVVCSAMGGTTDDMVALARSIERKPSRREMDVLLASGEQVSISLFAMALIKRGHPAKSYLGYQVPILTESVHGKARIAHIGTERLQADLAAGIIPVVAGFQGADTEGNVTTLGRGGSDTTGVALAVALEAVECQILSDVKGVYTTDPRMQDDARLIRRMSFEEMLELAGQGSRVLQIRSVEFASKYRMPIRVMSARQDDPGTLIGDEQAELEAPLVSGIAFSKDEAEISIKDLPNIPGVAHSILAPVSEAAIEVDMIVMTSVGDGMNLSFTVHREDFAQALALARRSAAGGVSYQVQGREDVVKISVVGVGMRSHAGIATTMFDALAGQGINVLAVTTSEIKIAVLVNETDLVCGVDALHGAFGLADPR